MEVPIKFFLLTIGTTCDTLKPKRRFDAKPNHRYLWDTPTTCHFSIKKNNNDKKKNKKKSIEVFHNTCSSFVTKQNSDWNRS
jgi:hypothetical protein